MCDIFITDLLHRWSQVEYPGSIPWFLKTPEKWRDLYQPNKKKVQLMQEKKTEETTCHLLTPFLLELQQKNKAFRFNNMNITISKDLILSNKHKQFMLQASCFHRNMIKEHHSIQISIVSHKTTNSFTFPQHSHRAFKFQPPQRCQIKSILFISPSTKTLRELLSNMTQQISLDKKKIVTIKLHK